MINIADVERLFTGSAPGRDELALALNNLGRTCLDSDAAVNRFGGHTREEVLQGIHNALEKGSATYAGLEEWTLLDSGALRYFVQAYLTYLQETLASGDPDQEFLSFFFYNLTEAIRINGPEAFTAPQYEFLCATALHTRAVVMRSPLFEDWATTIQANIDRFLESRDRAQRGKNFPAGRPAT